MATVTELMNRMERPDKPAIKLRFVDLDEIKMVCTACGYGSPVVCEFDQQMMAELEAWVALHRCAVKL